MAVFEEIIFIDVYFIQVLTKDEGGRYTPFASGYKPQLFFRTADVNAQLVLKEEEDGRMIMPGDNCEFVVTLHAALAVEVGNRFTLREGTRTSTCSPTICFDNF